MSTSSDNSDQIGEDSSMIGHTVKGDPKSRFEREQSPNGYIQSDIPLLLAYGFLRLKKEKKDEPIKTSFFEKLKGPTKEYDFVNTTKSEVLQFLRWATTKASFRHGIPPLLIKWLCNERAKYKTQISNVGNANPLKVSTYLTNKLSEIETILSVGNIDRKVINTSCSDPNELARLSLGDKKPVWDNPAQKPIPGKTLVERLCGCKECKDCKEVAKQERELEEQEQKRRESLLAPSSSVDFKVFEYLFDHTGSDDFFSVDPESTLSQINITLSDPDYDDLPEFNIKDNTLVSTQISTLYKHVYVELIKYWNVDIKAPYTKKSAKRYLEKIKGGLPSGPFQTNLTLEELRSLANYFQCLLTGESCDHIPSIISEGPIKTPFTKEDLSKILQRLKLLDPTFLEKFIKTSLTEDDIRRILEYFKISKEEFDSVYIPIKTPFTKEDFAEILKGIERLGPDYDPSVIKTTFFDGERVRYLHAIEKLLKTVDSKTLSVEDLRIKLNRLIDFAKSLSADGTPKSEDKFNKEELLTFIAELQAYIREVEGKPKVGGGFREEENPDNLYIDKLFETEDDRDDENSFKIVQTGGADEFYPNHPNINGERGLAQVLTPNNQDKFIFIGDLGDSIDSLQKILNHFLQNNIIKADGIMEKGYKLIFMENTDPNILNILFYLLLKNSNEEDNSQSVYIIRPNLTNMTEDSYSNLKRLLRLLPIVLEIKNPNTDQDKKEKFIYVSNGGYQIDTKDSTVCTDNKVLELTPIVDKTITSYIIENKYQNIIFNRDIFSGIDKNSSGKCYYGPKLIKDAIQKGYQFTIGHNSDTSMITSIIKENKERLIDLKNEIDICGSGSVDDEDDVEGEINFKCKSYIADLHIDKDSKVKINEDTKEDILPVVRLRGYSSSPTDTTDTTHTNHNRYGYGILSFSTGPECKPNDVFVCATGIGKDDLTEMTKDIDEMLELLDKIAIAERRKAAAAKRPRSTAKGRTYRKNTTYKNRR
jgi:hypothetical protein